MAGINTTKPIVLQAPISELGEGPCWDERTGRLMWVDVNQGRIHSRCPATGEVETIRAPSRVSALIPCVQGGWLVAAYHSLYFWETGSPHFEECMRLEHLPDNVRFNDGKAGPDGGLWLGTMDMNGEQAEGILYRVDKSLRREEKIHGITCSNGMDWSLDGSEMYYIDSAIRQVRAYAFDPVSGTLGDQRTAVVLEESSGGVPDGMCLDQEGMIWLAQWGGARVARWDPADGRQLAVISLPALQSTSCAFGGPNYDVLYMTSATEGMSGAQHDAYPHSGALFQLNTREWGIRGRAPFRFDVAKG